MDKAIHLEQLSNSNKLLKENNDLLIKTHTKTSALFDEISKKQEKILTCFGKVYSFINSKNNKTWEEHEIVEELYDLITNSKTGDTEKGSA